MITRPKSSQTKTPCEGCCSTRISVSLTHYTFLENGDGGARSVHLGRSTCHAISGRGEKSTATDGFSCRVAPTSETSLEPFWGRSLAYFCRAAKKSYSTKHRHARPKKDTNTHKKRRTKTHACARWCHSHTTSYARGNTTSCIIHVMVNSKLTDFSGS